MRESLSLQKFLNLKKEILVQGSIFGYSLVPENNIKIIKFLIRAQLGLRLYYICIN